MIDLNKYYVSSEYQGASAGNPGRSGYVPEALSGDEFKFLRGDGTWQNAITDLGSIPSLSSNWNSAFTTVQNNSASWEESTEILPTVTNYLSTNNVLISGLSVTNNISAAGSVISRIPLVFTELSSYTLSLIDQSNLITINNSLTSFVYIPNDTSVNFGDGSQINISRLGSGTVTISALDGVVLRSADNRNQLRTQNSTATIVKLSANDWLLFGDIS